MFKFKKKDTIKKTRNANKKNLFGLVLSVFVAICVFVGLTSYQTTLLSDYEKVTRVISIKTIPKGTLITEKNVANYFTTDEIEAHHDVASSVNEINDMIGYISNADIANGQTISLINFVEKNHLLANKADIVYVSFTVSKAGDAVGGTIREGNIIDVTVKTNDGVVSAGESLYVNAVYDTSYRTLTETDDTPATTIEVALDKNKANDFIDAISSGTIYVSLID